MGKLWGDLCENQDENWPRYNGTALYSYFMQISHVSCIWPSGFCPGSLGYCKPRFIPTYVFMFWNRNLVFKLTTIDVPSGLQTRNFQSSVIHHHEFSLNLTYISANLSVKSPGWKAQLAAIGVIWISAGSSSSSSSSNTLLPLIQDKAYIEDVAIKSLTRTHKET